MSSAEEEGGFLHLTLPTPRPSPAVDSTESSILPPFRNKPLKPGSVKESMTIRLLDEKLLDISRRYEKRVQHGSLAADIKWRGWKEYGQIAQALETIVDIVWVSATPTIQIPYLLNVALASLTYLPSFPFSPKKTFSLLQKLDLCFSSMLQGIDVESKQPLPGRDGGRGKMSMTEKVRLRGIVSQMRVIVVEVASKDGSTTDASVVRDTENMSSTTLTDDEGDVEMDEDDLEDASNWEMDVARVFQRTIVDLGLALDEPRGSGFE
ncbi:hypothetical protein MMC25_003132 [Agyrium rufum]|nr:hypothetical protein [Agyrium rufum]